MHVNSRLLASLVALSLVILLSVSCSSDSGSGAPQEAPVVGEETEATLVHVAFAGGGWRAHTGHAAWTTSLLEDGHNTLYQAFANVQTLSSNSGGTWFLSMLAYSKAFNANFDIYAKEGGYLEQQRQLFDAFDSISVDSNLCLLLGGQWSFYCQLASLADASGLNWAELVKNIVFEPFEMNKELETTVLSDARQDWATDKSLLMAATLLTDKVVLDSDIFRKVYYEAMLSGSGNGQNIDVYPVMFASVEAGRITPPFLSAGAFDVTYAATDDPIGPLPVKIMDPLSSDSVPVLRAAAASSAAVGAAASYGVLSDNLDVAELLLWDAAYGFSDLAVSFKLISPLEGGIPKGSPSEVADEKFARLADGGYVDNAAVAQLVSSLQANDEASNFQIVAFDNVQALFTPQTNQGVPNPIPSPLSVSVNFAILFGQGPKEACSSHGICVQVPARQVFEVLEPGKFTTTQPIWSWTAPRGAGGPAGLTYTRYKVTTFDNPAFGVKAGSQGVLHVFTCLWPDAGTAPEKGSSDFDAYEAMFSAIGTGLKYNDNEGLNHLQEALAGEVIP
jgi:hypothetical protein